MLRTALLLVLVAGLGACSSALAAFPAVTVSSRSSRWVTCFNLATNATCGALPNNERIASTTQGANGTYTWTLTSPVLNTTTAGTYPLTVSASVTPSP